jgi:hypothetical protein
MKKSCFSPLIPSCCRSTYKEEEGDFLSCSTYKEEEGDFLSCLQKHPYFTSLIVFSSCNFSWPIVNLYGLLEFRLTQKFNPI